MKASKTIDVTVTELLDARHPAVIQRRVVVKDKGIIAVGDMVGITSDGFVVPAATTGATLFGVATTGADTATGKDDAVNVLVHGTCKKSLVTKAGAVVTQADVDNLLKIGVYAMEV